jgi:DNA (cytosine-5)-methyltransferase 1
VPSFYEFFAGGGMARAGLGPDWTCLFANDIDLKKGTSYAVNWGAGALKIGDVADVTPADLPAGGDLAWASFPCQDLSLAGDGAGLKGERSGTFWPFWKVMKALASEGRAPRVIVLENVCGALTSHDGKDFAAIGAALAGGGYQFGSLVLDAVHFLPQSRPRLFIVAVRQEAPAPLHVVGVGPEPPWHTGALVEAYNRLSKRSQEAWAWWRLPAAPRRELAFVDLIEAEPKGVPWHTREETKKLLGMMSRINFAKVEAAKKMGRRMVGGIYKRTRRDERGRKVQRAEIRFDDVAGCLRTPVGGSSRQTIMIVEGNAVRSRLLSPREAARLMGLPDGYILPGNYNEAYHLAGDGLAVPVVRFLAENLLEPILATALTAEKAAA